MDQGTHIAISGWPYFAAGQRFGDAGVPARGARMVERYAPDSPNASLSAIFTETLWTEDTRLPRMTMRLGIVTGATGLFYPMDLLEERGALIDEVDGRTVLVFVDPMTFTPAAPFVDAASATLEDREVHLDSTPVASWGGVCSTTPTVLAWTPSGPSNSSAAGTASLDFPRPGDLRPVASSPW